MCKSLYQLTLDFLSYKERDLPRRWGNREQGLSATILCHPLAEARPLGGHGHFHRKCIPPAPAPLVSHCMVYSKDLLWHFSFGILSGDSERTGSEDNCLLRRSLVWQIRVGCWIVQYSWARQLRNSTYHFTGQLIHSCPVLPGRVSHAKPVGAAESDPSQGKCLSFRRVPKYPRNVPPAFLEAYNSTRVNTTTSFEIIHPLSCFNLSEPRDCSL